MFHDEYDINGTLKYLFCSFTYGIHFYKLYGFSYAHYETKSQRMRLKEPTITICISTCQVLPVNSLISMECLTEALKSHTILNDGQDLKGNMKYVKTLEESE